MKRSILFTGIIGLAIITVTTAAWARGGYGCGYGSRNRGAQCCGYGPCASQSSRSAQNRNYDPSTAERVSGEVVKVERVTGRGRSGGVHLLVKTDKETTPVHVAPQWFLNDRNIAFKAGDKVDVSGSRITYEDKLALIADQITHDGTNLKLRDSDGIPLWSGRNRSY
jgi:hypothetical protein